MISLKPHCPAFLRIALLVSLVALANPAELLAAPPSATIPPADLLNLLPKVPLDWKCTKSMGVIDFSVMGNPQTTVIRKYEIPLKPEKPTDPPPPPGKFSLAVLDLGTQGNAGAVSTDPKKSTAADSLDLSLFSGHLTERSNKGISFVAPIGPRLLLQATSQNLKPDEFKSFLKSFDFGPIVAQKDKLPSTPLKESTKTQMAFKTPITVYVIEFQSNIVDELNPKSNRSWDSSISRYTP